MKSDEPSATGTVFTNVDVYDGQSSEGLATLDQLAYDAGHVALTFSNASAENDTIMYMIRGQGGYGPRKWTYPERQLFSKTTSYPSGDVISEERRHVHENALNFVADHVARLPGVIAHPYVGSVGPVIEGPEWPDNADGWAAVQERNDGPAGNARLPPAQPYMTTVIGYTQWDDNQNKLISEIMEALGLNDYYTNNGVAFTQDEDFQFNGLNNVGQVVLSVANTYLDGDFMLPGANFSEPSVFVDGFGVSYSSEK
jgi:hypothetical protein